jgi:hypothetical protein
MTEAADGSFTPVLPAVRVTGFLPSRTKNWPGSVLLLGLLCAALRLVYAGDSVSLTKTEANSRGLGSGDISAPNSTPTTGPVPAMLRFSEVEIRSRTWTDTHGRHLALLEWFQVRSYDGDQLLIAKYGDTSTKRIFCLDFYRAITPADRPRVPDYLLLAHDLAESTVTSIAAQTNGTLTVFNIVRETVPGTSQPRRKYDYYLSYSDRFVIDSLFLRNSVTEIPSK